MSSSTVTGKVNASMLVSHETEFGQVKLGDLSIESLECDITHRHIPGPSSFLGALVSMDSHTWIPVKQFSERMHFVLLSTHSRPLLLVAKGTGSGLLSR